MSILLLSLLFAVLLVVGVYLQPRRIEAFVDTGLNNKPISPALSSLLLSMPDTTQANKKTNVDALSRDDVLQKATTKKIVVEKPKKKKVTRNKKGCPVCPDMSKYVRLDEVPCWNCSLP